MHLVKVLLIPIIKDKHGDVSSVENYRPITLSPIISKVFESFLLEKYAEHFITDDLQFGFKKGLGCGNAIFALRHVVDFYNERNSNVYIASLDASKAFDRVNHFKLYSCLIKKGLPASFINTIVNWYSKLSVMVRWNEHDSSSLAVLSGLRQGGVLSPTLFNLYVDSMICKLRRLGCGCHIDNTFIACIMYADDILLLSASVIDLQTMLDACEAAGQDLGIHFNSKKTMCLVIGPNKISNIASMTLNGTPLHWVNELKYLGITLSTGKSFSPDLKTTRRKFFVGFNSIINKCKYVSDTVKLELLETQCLPILLYCIECFDLKSSKLKEINSWWNAVYRKIFGYNKWESIKEIICLFGRLDLIHIVNMRRLMFIKRLSKCNNSVISVIMKRYMQSPELVDIENQHNIKVNWSPAKIKAVTFAHFRGLFV